MSTETSRLAVFDLDGTLTDTVGVDDRCYAQALADCFGFSPRVEDYDWNEATDVSDFGILEHLCRERLGRPPSDAELGAFEEVFVNGLRDAVDEAPETMQPVPGAVPLLEALNETGWRIAIATGGLRRSAELKLERAAIPRTRIHAMASGSDAAPRTEIVHHAVQRAGFDAGDGYVLVGDGRWDLVTAQALGRPFVGRATGAKAALLRELGAEHVLSDYRDTDAVVSLFESLVGRRRQ